VNFQQLRIIRETVRQNFNLTEASAVLFTSQSGVSKHIKDLEDELGLQLFVRKGKRILGLTEPGMALHKIVERMLVDADNIRRLADDFNLNDEGTLTIATTHTQARYILPPVIDKFKRLFPKVHLILQQANPTEIINLLLHGNADIGIASELLNQDESIVRVPYYQWKHCIITPRNHPLTSIAQPQLSQLCDYPLITYHEGFTGRATIDKAFLAQNLHANIVMTALDSDVIKTYVELGLGVGIINSLAYHPNRDKHLCKIESDLFEHNTTWIALRKGFLLRGFGYDFISLCYPDTDIRTLKSVAHL
jgi:LysR family cys regulon transcriptional activator